MRSIELTQGQTTLVDDADFEQLSQYKWRLSRGGNVGYSYYAVTTVKNNNKEITVRMHRLIMNSNKDESVDHCNGNGLDNRRKNLRLCTCSQNQANRTKQINNKSGFKGVSWRASRKKWQVRVMQNRKSYFLGYFTDKIEAAKEYDRKAVELFGKFARTNFNGALN